MTFSPIGKISTQRQHKVKEISSRPTKEEKELRQLQLSGQIPTGYYQYLIYKRMGYDVSNVVIFNAEGGGVTTKENYESDRAPILIYGDLVRERKDGNTKV